jgi:hypothetical protein
MCPNTDPCWWHTTVTLPDEIAVENFETRQVANLKPQEVRQLVGYLKQDGLCNELLDPEPTCQVVFDADVILTVTSNGETHEDRFAGGCIVPSEQAPDPVYRDLALSLRDLARSYFPGVLPE